MIGLVLVTHGRLALEFIDALEHIVGPQQRVKAVCIGPSDDMEAKRRAIIESVEEVDEGDGAVVLTDMFGGTPSNLAISIMEGRKVEIIAGMNLPMLIKLAGLRNGVDLHGAAQQAHDAGHRHMSLASEMLKNRNGGQSRRRSA